MAEPLIRFVASPGAKPPDYRSPGASGADISAFLAEPLLIEPGDRASVPTGIRIELPEGYEAQVRPRSGLALERGLTCLNSPGTIDADYRGEIRVILINHGRETVSIANGERIAQLVIAPVARALFMAATAIGDTDRGGGGFGSTGIR
jgi:dUTP pyrophosphatase